MTSQRFLESKFRTPQQRAVEAALADLPVGVAARTCAEFLATGYGECATWNYGAVTKRGKWWGWLLGKPVRDWTDVVLPGDDHVEHREKDGVRSYISQPYGLHWEQIRALVKHCEANGLTVSIDPRSWYFPGECCAVVIRADRRA